MLRVPVGCAGSVRVFVSGMVTNYWFIVDQAVILPSIIWRIDSLSDTFSQ